MEVHEGGCLCGDIRYRASGQPVRVLVCHCRFCQRRTGTAFGIETIFSKEKVEFTGIARVTYQTSSKESGRWIKLDFCSRCGTNVGALVEHGPAHYVISGGTLDDPNWFDVSMHILTQSMVPWMVLSESCERHDRGSPPASPRVTAVHGPAP